VQPVIDTRCWDELASVFTSDAVLDYRSAGGIRGSLAEVGERLATVIPFFTWSQHLVVDRAVDLVPGADEAIPTRTEPSSTASPGSSSSGATYLDHLIRTAGGRRISHRVEETLWWDNPMPRLPASPPPVPDDAFP
jgi:hypothetical protein